MLNSTILFNSKLGLDRLYGRVSELPLYPS